LCEALLPEVCVGAGHGGRIVARHNRRMTWTLLGIDFTSVPSRRKPITVARGVLTGNRLALQRVHALCDFAAFEALLAQAGPWLGAFDFPFGLPRGFVDAHALGDNAVSVVRALRQRCPTRMAFRGLVDAWGNSRPAGRRLPHRTTDAAMDGVMSTSPLQTRYVPVGFMHYEGMFRLAAAGVNLPGIAGGDARRVALEGYPGLLAHELIGRRSYKNSAEPDRLIARKDLLDALEQGRTRLALRLAMSHAQRDMLAADASADTLDAVLCMVQAGWASLQPRFGLPGHVDPVEGWIASALGVAPPLAPLLRKDPQHTPA
jgi:hypothetical protein